MRRRSQRGMVIMALALILAGGAGFVYYLNTKPLIPAGATAAYAYYARYLKRDAGQEAKIYVYLDPVSDNGSANWYVSIYNATDDFYCGQLTLTDEAGQTVFSQSFVNIRPQEVRMLALKLASRPADYRLRDSRFFSFGYPKPAVSAALSKDSDAGNQYVWNNLVFASADLTPENCLEYGKYIYIEDELAGMDSPDTYCYDAAQTEYTQSGGASWPVQSSAKFGIVIDHDAKTIKVVDLTADMEILAQTDMK